jgi:hypothetical protein
MKKTLLLLFIAIFLVSCNNTSPTKNQSSDGSAVNTTNPKAKGKYALKSGIVEYKTKMMGYDVVQTLYFDDYGAKDATQLTMDMMGTKMITYTVTKDGFVYNYDPVKKTGTKASALAGAGSLNFEDLSDKVVKDWNLQKVGKETVIGKECEKFSLDNPSMNIKGFYWVWKGIALKMDADMSTVKMQMEATSIQENVNIPADKFEIPADIVFQ